jgi:hypothetical protein
LRGKRKPHLFLASTPPRRSLWQISPADLMVRIVCPCILIFYLFIVLICLLILTSVVLVVLYFEHTECVACCEWILNNNEKLGMHVMFRLL